MSDDQNPIEAVTDELKDQLDVASLVTGDDVAEQIDGTSLGRSVGAALGALVGRRFGRRVSRRVRSKFLGGDDADAADRSLFERVVGTVLVALGRTLEQPQFRDPLEDAFRKVSESQEAAEDAAEEAEESAEDAAEEAEESAEDAAEEVEEGAEEVEEGAGDIDAADVSPSELQELKSETYRELLEIMEYSQLQSIAKEVGVRANQGREDMVDDIVEQFDESSSESGGGDEPDANDAEGDETDQ